MLKRGIVLPTVLLLFVGNAFGELQFETTDSVISFLEGEWLWNRSSGGYSGETIYPDAKTSKRYVFSKHENRQDFIVQCHYRNDTLVDSGNAKISFSNSMYGERWHFDRFTSITLALFFFTEDRISFAEHCYDCYRHTYKRKMASTGIQTGSAQSVPPPSRNPGLSSRHSTRANHTTGEPAAIINIHGQILQQVNAPLNEMQMFHLQSGHYCIRFGTQCNPVLKKVVIGK